MPCERLLAEARKLAADIAVGAQPRQFTLYRCAHVYTYVAAGVPAHTAYVA